MVEIKRQVKEGFEKEFESLTEKKSALEAEKKLAIEEAVKKVEDSFSERGELLEKLLVMISDEVEVEIPEDEADTQETESESINEEDPEYADEGELPAEEIETAEQPVQLGERVDPSQIRI